MAKYAGEHIKCIVFNSPGAEYHHIYTRGANPGAEWIDEPWNIIPVCHELHNLFHKEGTSYMAKRFPSIKAWLERNGWEYDNFAKKWRHEK